MRLRGYSTIYHVHKNMQGTWLMRRCLRYGLKQILVSQHQCMSAVCWRLYVQCGLFLVSARVLAVCNGTSKRRCLPTRISLYERLLHGRYTVNGLVTRWRCCLPAGAWQRCSNRACG
jgi:hypothetical protein